MISKKLLPYEWTAIAVMICLFIGIGAISYFYHHEIPAEINRQAIPMIDIYVEGAIETPGHYELKKGTRFEGLLSQLKLLPEADTTEIKLRAILKHGQIVTIPYKTITVFIEGAVASPKSLVIPRSSRLEDLIDHIQLSENADIRYLKKKRQLRDQEKIIVPIKKKKAK